MHTIYGNIFLKAIAIFISPGKMKIGKLFGPDEDHIFIRLYNFL